MENASKALIIAGAILLAISIIGIGMFVFDQASGALGDIGMDKEKIATYNEYFLRFEGRKSGEEVRNLCDAVRNHNLSNLDDETKNVNILFNRAASATTAPTTIVQSTVPDNVKRQIRAGREYTVSVSYDRNTGLIVEIGVVPVR